MLTPILDAIGDSVHNNTIPQHWLQRSYPSLKPLLSYIRDLGERVGMFRSWIQRGSTPTQFWLPGFYFTQSFFTGLKQHYARQKNIAIDLISFRFWILDAAVDNSERVGALVFGTFLEGSLERSVHFWCSRGG